ncbi:MAG: hypothetical protein ACEQSL_01745 [Sediminibacterium sp.]
MVSVFLNGGWLDLGTDATFGIDVLHPAFSDNVLGGAFTLPLDIPVTDPNKALLGLINLVETDGMDEWPCAVYYKSNLFSKGKLIIDKKGSKSLGGYISMGMRSFNVLDKKMNEVNWGRAFWLGDTQDDILATAVDYYNNADWTWGFNFPAIHNEDFYGDKNKDWGGFINNYDTTTFIKNENHGPGIPVNVNALVPCFYPVFLLKKIFAEESLELDLDFISNYPEMHFDTMLLTNNYPLDRLGEAHFAASVEHDANTVYASSLNYEKVRLGVELSDPDNIYDTTLFEYTIQGADPFYIEYGWQASRAANPWENTAVMRVILFFGATQIHSSGFYVPPVATRSDSWAHTGVFAGGDVGQKIYLMFQHSKQSNTAIGEKMTMDSAYLRIRIEAGSEINEMNPSVEIKNHVPDWTVREFLEQWRDAFNFSFLVDPFIQKIYLRRNGDAIDKSLFTTEDITRKADTEHTSQANDLKVKTLAWDFPGDDGLVENNFKEYDRGASLPDVDTYLSLPTPTVLGQTIRVDDTNRRYVTVIDSTSTMQWAYLRDDYDPVNFDQRNNRELKPRLTPVFMEYLHGSNWYLTAGVLFPGERYKITTYVSADDFKNVGAGENATGEIFVATGAIPTVWTNGSRLDTVCVVNADDPLVLPTILQAASSLAFNMGINSFTPRFMWWQPGKYYPFATTRPTAEGAPADAPGARWVDGEAYDYYRAWIICILNNKDLWSKDVMFDFNDYNKMQTYKQSIFYAKHIKLVDIVIKQISFSMGEEIGISQVQYFRKQLLQ